MHFIGIDIGTTTLCGIVYSPADKSTTTITRANASVLETSHSWELIQDPAVIVSVVIEIIDQCIAQYPDIQGIGITGQMHGILYVNKSGQAVSPLYNWQDKRGDLPFRNNKTYAEHLSEVSGFRLSTGYGTVTHFFNITNGLVPSDAVACCTIMDYLVMVLTGGQRPVMDYTNAAGLGFFKEVEKQFDHTALEAAGIDAAIFPKTVESARLAGFYKMRIPVHIAIGDNQAGFLGAVTDRERSIHLTIGTSSQLSVFSADYFRVSGLDTRPFPGGGYLLVGAALAGGQSLTVLHTLFNSVVQFSGKGSLGLAEFYHLIHSGHYSSNDQDVLTVNTQFYGKRQDPFARGAIANISPANFTAGDLIHGFFRGISNELYDFYTALPAALKKGKSMLIGSGNAIKKNALLCSTLEEIFQYPVITTEQDEDAAYGAAIVAATH